jgi:hypothetical protein
MDKKLQTAGLECSMRNLCLSKVEENRLLHRGGNVFLLALLSAIRSDKFLVIIRAQKY